MSIENEQDREGLMKIGRIVGETLKELQAAAAPGITTRELDHIAAAVLLRQGARPAPLITYGFPGVACISINDEAAHGIPGERRVKAGDLVKFDVSAELDGYYADAATTIAVPPVSKANQKLMECARYAFDAALAAARAGNSVNHVGKAAETAARKRGFKIVRGLMSHGVGRALHEEPNVPNFYMPELRGQLTDGLVITIEPHISASTHSYYTDRDGWTLRTPDRSTVANFEHTIIVTAGAPIIVTAY